MISIDRNVPLPPQQEFQQKTAKKYPFDLMEIGDSFPVKLTDYEPGLTSRKLMQRISPAASRHAKNHSRKYTLRIMENGDVRVWRIE